MFTGGMTIGQIAAARHLAESTVFGHLAQYVLEDRLPLDQLVPQEHTDRIRNHALQHPDRARASEIRDAVGDDISYSEIALVKRVYGIEEPKNDDLPY